MADVDQKEEQIAATVFALTVVFLSDGDNLHVPFLIAEIHSADTHTARWKSDTLLHKGSAFTEMCQRRLIFSEVVILLFKPQKENITLSLLFSHKHTQNGVKLHSMLNCYLSVRLADYH